ncbi:MAG: hypothetical protein QM755_17790 [Luteolibacter sp.]
MPTDPAVIHRSQVRRSWIILIGVAVVTVALWAGFFGIQRYRERSAIRAWEEFKARATASGESFAWSPVPVYTPIPEDRNFLAHPWVRDWVTSRSHPARPFIETLGAACPADYEYPAEGNSWLATHPDATAAILATGSEHEADLSALREAAMRPECIPLSTVDTTALQYLSDLQKPVALHAEASLAKGHTVTAIQDLEILLLTARHLHSTPCALALVMACGFENKAVEVIRVGLKTGAFSAEEKLRLAHACRATPVQADLMTAMRNERGRLLSTLDMDVVPAGLPFRPGQPFQPWKRFRARSSLTYCELLQPGLSPGASTVDWQTITDRARQIMNDKKADPADKFAASMVNLLASVCPPLIEQDQQMQDIRRQLTE